jgi:hypothetical protein
MLQIIKKLLCKHPSIGITTEASFDKLYIVKSVIKCADCEKTFPIHPHANCCYVQHLHGEILREQYFKVLGVKMTQSGMYQQTSLQEYYHDNHSTQSSNPNDEYKESTKGIK